jgi:hypothetical protein
MIVYIYGASRHCDRDRSTRRSVRVGAADRGPDIY